MGKIKEIIDDNLDNLFMSVTPYNFKDKTRAVNDIVQYWLTKTLDMFIYEGLPEGINVRDMELLIQQKYCIIPFEKIEYEGERKYYALFGSLGGGMYPNYTPKQAIINNPWLNNYSRELIIDKECVVLYNDKAHKGLIELFRKWATLLVENELTMKINIVLKRIQLILSACDDTSQKSAVKFIKDVEQGEIGAILNKRLFEDEGSKINSLPFTHGETIRLSENIEMEQYITAKVFNEIGLNANYNMKRESINSGEAVLNDDALIPLIYDMLQQRREQWGQCYKYFGLEKPPVIKFSPLWERQYQEVTETEDNEDETN